MTVGNKYSDYCLTKNPDRQFAKGAQSVVAAAVSQGAGLSAAGNPGPAPAGSDELPGFATANPGYLTHEIIRHFPR